jgi:hypothetical protein
MAVGSARKQKTFPALDAPIPDPVATLPAATLDSDTSDDDSDVPEAVTLTGGRAAAHAKASAIEDHQKRCILFHLVK